MNQKLWSSVDDYLCGALIPADSVLEAALEASATAIQTVGVKGYDGLTLALVN